MTREDVKKIFPDATDEQLAQIMASHGKDVEKHKGMIADLTKKGEELTKAGEFLQSRIAEMEKNATSADDFKKKLEDLQKQIEAEHAEAKKKAEEAERAKAISARFGLAKGEKNFRHPAIEKDYLNRFAAALTDKAYEGKSDIDILSELTKDDPDAYKGVEAVKIPGGQKKAEDSEEELKKARAIMGLS